VTDLAADWEAWVVLPSHHEQSSTRKSVEEGYVFCEMPLPKFEDDPAIAKRDGC
jgi:hypothetical protein